MRCDWLCSATLCVLFSQLLASCALPQYVADPFLGTWVLRESSDYQSQTLIITQDAVGTYVILHTDGSIHNPTPESDGSWMFQPNSLSAAPWVCYRYDASSDQIIVTTAATRQAYRYKRLFASQEHQPPARHP
jgi:hypothetical protein